MEGLAGAERSCSISRVNWTSTLLLGVLRSNVRRERGLAATLAAGVAIQQFDRVLFIMHGMNISDSDLNLLHVFRAVYATRNVSRAAERLELSQPAVSHALTRLRLALKDPLFRRGPGGVRRPRGPITSPDSSTRR